MPSPPPPSGHPVAHDALRTAVQPRRLQILELIWDRERTVSEIADRLPVSIAAVSQHLARLKAAGLVRVRVDGRHRHYRARRSDMGALAVVLESFWTDRLDALAQMAREMEQAPNDPTSVTDVPPDHDGEPAS